MAKHPVEGRLYRHECYRKRKKEIAEAHTIATTDTIKSAQKMGLPESEVVGVQEKMQRKLHLALHELDRQCLSSSK